MQRYINLDLVPQHYFYPEFYSEIIKREDTHFDKCILGDSITFGSARKNCITYCFPGAKIEDLYHAVPKVETNLMTNNLLNPRSTSDRIDTPTEAIEKYKRLVKICQDKGFQVTVCPLFGIQDKKLIVKEFNRLLVMYAKTQNIGICSIKDVSYRRDVGDINRLEFRDGIHPIPDRIMKIASAFTF